MVAVVRRVEGGAARGAGRGILELTFGGREGGGGKMGAPLMHDLPIEPVQSGEKRCGGGRREVSFELDEFRVDLDLGGCWRRGEEEGLGGMEEEGEVIVVVK